MPGWWVLLWSLSTAEGAGDACGAARGRAAVSGGSVARCTPARAATSLTSIPDNTARTASNRCSTTDKTIRANPGLPESGTSHEDVPIQSADHDPMSHIT